VLKGLVSGSDTSHFVVNAVRVFSQLTACGEAIPADTLGKLHRCCTKADMLDDAFDVLSLAKETMLQEKPKAYRKLASDTLSACIRLQQPQRAQSLFEQMV
jgi:hypothetical protein